MVDEEAFGLLVSWCHVDDLECALPAEEFLQARERFRATLGEIVAEHEWPPDVRLLDFGHALYLETLAEGLALDPIAFLREARARLDARDVASICVLAHGVVWREDDPERAAAATNVVTCGSEPLRRALRAEAAAVLDADRGTGWGPGIYLDLDALEALGKKLRNQPTTLDVAGATFCRVGR